MAADASKALGAPEIAGTLVNPKGLMKKSVARVAGREVAGLVGGHDVVRQFANLRGELGFRSQGGKRF